MAHFSTTLAMAGSGDTIHFDSLEFPALSPARMRVPPVFDPSQAFLFGSQNFVADRLGVPHLREEAHIPAPVGGAPSINFGTHGFDDVASALLFKQTLFSNPTVSNTCNFYLPFIYCLPPITRRDCTAYTTNTVWSVPL